MEAAESLFECLEHVADPRRARGSEEKSNEITDPPFGIPFRPYCV